MCEYCENKKEVRSITFNGDTSICIFENELYVDGDIVFKISHCPMCRKEAGRVKRHASGYWYQFIIPRRLTLPPTRIYRWLNFYWRLKDKEESYDK